ncbi:MAG: bifunctional [glutamate--ammonia ligase]-adenylyl-L-tyrosine phosphorylase/[glutamate--ammonia-ligase] adenylyltransferase, partial [Planctomycetales bacterium]|nr:bifunctional [glutamate--ammonia ligase]-adenylyl-L-tyrosine phosphorylase/[glutamate--ammonia-ligase] adenylyltransferase [Planctomycetales bacterium]
MTEGRPVARDVLVEEIAAEVESLSDEAAVMAALRRIKQRETLRIAYGDLIRDQNVEVVTRQISFLAEALVEAALAAAYRKLAPRYRTPRRPDGQRCRFTVLALGKLGGGELNYSSDIDLMFLYESDGASDGEKSIAPAEFFDRLGRQIVKLLAESTAAGVVYRVDLRLRPEGALGPMATSLAAALGYYDVMGRTWERQAFVKARPVAGDHDFGAEFLRRLEPWIWRRYLNRADIGGVKALKRRIERRATIEQGDARNVKTGRGGIRDIEFAIQFLQLLNGGDLPEIRTGNTLEAIMALERDGCLTYQERSILETNYAFLRRLEHRLQILFDLQTHVLPDGDDELRKVAIRMGFHGTPHRSALDAFKSSFAQKTAENRKILDHLLHDAFADSPQAEPEVDLILDPSPSAEAIAATLAPYAFRDPQAAYANLTALATERVRFLSTRRCRHFLASIAPRLLQAICQTPDPDGALVNLARVSDSLGGKGALWELFSASGPSLELYVRLCGAGAYLADILTSHPGMIDELMDSLVLDKLPTLESLEPALADRLHGAQDPAPILHSFKSAMHLRVGVRDILGKVDIQAAHHALADIGEAVLRQCVHLEMARLVDKYGEPSIAAGPRAGEPCELVILALGKMGGREPNYHSDIDIMFLYEAEGSTRPLRPSQRGHGTSNQHFFGELGQRLMKLVSHAGPFGPLYALDPRLRPAGRNGVLAMSLPEFIRYHESGQGQLWERQALCKARPVVGSPEAVAAVMRAVRGAVLQSSWRPEFAEQIRSMRHQLEESAEPRNLKRGPGGTVDIEFIVQMLQLKHAAEHPAVLVTGTIDALAALRAARLISEDDFALLDKAYRQLRTIEARLRLMNTTARHDFPSDSLELQKLAWLLDYSSGEALREETLALTSETR